MRWGENGNQEDEEGKKAGWGKERPSRKPKTSRLSTCSSNHVVRKKAEKRENKPYTKESSHPDGLAERLK